MLLKLRFYIATVFIYLVSPIHYQYAWVRMCMEYGYVPYFQGAYYYYSSIKMLVDIVKEVAIENGN